ncbi:MAG: succinylglutamate desuccinylase/aspartoacylase family protein [Pseudomonadota bacterium]|nr:succinylglutamate desuccinylase/aspartoacylase family protein [Pseudomonadota bacterium]
MKMHIRSRATPSGIFITEVAMGDGPTAAVFAGVHGNERGSRRGAQDFLSSVLKQPLITGGKLVVVQNANPLACILGKRSVDTDMARCINNPDAAGAGYESIPARELKELCDSIKPDAALDLHTMGGKTVFDPVNPLPVFGFLDHPENQEMLSALGVPTQVTGWPELHGQEYDLAMYIQSLGGKALVAECGHHDDPASAGSAWHLAVNLLRFMGMIPEDHMKPDVPSGLLADGKNPSRVHLVKRIPAVEGAVFAQAGFYNFMPVEPSQVITEVDGKPAFTVPDDGNSYRLVIPKTDNKGNITVPPGQTCALLGRVTTPDLRI